MLLSNANNYDLHLILQAMAEIPPELIKEPPKVIPMNTSRLRSLTLNSFEFKGRYINSCIVSFSAFHF